MKPKPFLKWAGGKRWFVANYKNIIPQFNGKYVEPFLGSGVVFFHLTPRKGIIADINEELITTYQAIKDSHVRVTNELNNLKELGADYYDVREWSPEDRIQTAARFIYLNRTCWNGLYRVNKQGQFNVPRGTKKIENYPEDDFSVISNSLQKIHIRKSDFKRTIGYAREGDLVFTDPPYTVRHNNNGFIKYNENIFSWENQKELSYSLIKAAERGCKIICTNANHSSIKALYPKELFSIKEVSRFSSISSKTSSRNVYKEIIIQSI
ncbi:DNA adenine methylase [Muriicola jejuensis]|uniref:Site-specific DNA-methyltransferase (adenine-specific) n=1 Tax=Muriicola jejuensis TaxID=504488 RepID=A0A6P0UBP4_9FLAO|nr:Dam family site-specific DNA-(adenine-N6)-methyltransferase [Muriicola jejuensis]NER10032.1 Dam family site-specific DNA-(adenine-N6)-methyltransferase [Muriicola jejuensis]SMP03597.1 DNA adenine methylase [Muriicola jejuensis]